MERLASNPGRNHHLLWSLLWKGNTNARFHVKESVRSKAYFGS